MAHKGLWPALSVVTQAKPLLIFGGYPLNDKIAWMTGEGLKVEWLGNDQGSRAAGAARGVAARIRRGGASVVIVLNGLIGHQESDVILAACRAAGTPYALGQRAGHGQLRTIFGEFEVRFTP